MRFAIQTPPEHTSFDALAEVWQAADDLGFWGAFTFDHLVPLGHARPGRTFGAPRGPQFDGWISLTALATRTRRLQVGTLVTGVTYRHPVLLAKMAVTLDHATGGRAILGVGAAWHADEHRMYGIKFPAVDGRMTLLNETLTAFRLLCTQEVTSFQGRHVKLKEAVFEPKPVRPDGIPVLVGGSGQRLKRIAARHADVFHSFPPPWEWAAVNADLDAKLAAAGRRPDELVRSSAVFGELSGDPEREADLIRQVRRSRGGTEEQVRSRILIGSPEDMSRVARTYEAAGVSLLTINLRAPFDVPGLARFAAEVAPAFADGRDRAG